MGIKRGIVHTNGKHTSVPTVHRAYPPDAFEQQASSSIHRIGLSLMDRPITQYPSLRPRHSRQRETPLHEEFCQMTTPSLQQSVGSPGIYDPVSAYRHSCSEYISADIPTRMRPPLVHPIQEILLQLARGARPMIGGTEWQSSLTIVC